MAIVGLVYGTLIGLFGHWLLFFQLKRNKKKGSKALGGLGAVFLARYLIDGLFLLLFAAVTRNAIAITTAALSITVAVKIALILAYVRKGGKF